MVPSERHPAPVQPQASVSAIMRLGRSNAAGRSRGLVAAHTPANDEEKVAVFISQASGEEVTPAFLPVVPLSHPLGETFPHVAAPAAAIFIIIVAVTPIADPLAQAAPEFWPLTKKIDDEIPQVFACPYPIPQQVAQVAVHLTVPIVPPLGRCGARCRTNNWSGSSNCENCCSNQWQPYHCILLSVFVLGTPSKRPDDLHVPNFTGLIGAPGLFGSGGSGFDLNQTDVAALEAPGRSSESIKLTRRSASEMAA